MKPIPTLTAVLVLLLAAFSCGQDQPVEAGADTASDEETVPDGSPGLILGVCFMDGLDCVTTYLDLGDYEDSAPAAKREMVPVYVFPSVTHEDGGLPNPWDPHGHYRPFRLQNNVFAGPGRVWCVWEVHSANLTLMAEPQPGVKLWGAGAGPRIDGADDEDPAPEQRVRDLFLAPITSEAELLALEQAGDVTLVNTFVMVDCPITEAKPGDEIVNLNPHIPVCGAE